METVETEFEIDIDSIELELELNESKENESLKFKFLIIKSIYLDFIRIYSCLTWFLQAIESNESIDLTFLKHSLLNIDSIDNLDNLNLNNLKEILLKSFLNTLTLDLYYLNPKNEILKIPSAFSFIASRDKFIALNLFNVVKNTDFENEFSQWFNLLYQYIQTVYLT